MARVKKIKIRSKKAAPRKMAIAKRRPALKKLSGIKIKNDFPGQAQLAVLSAKYSPAQVAQVKRPEVRELPRKYDRDRIVLQVRDPWWLHSYWGLKDSTIERLKSELKDDFYRAQRVLRVYDVSQINFNGHNAHRFFDLYVNEHSDSWYIDTGAPGRSWCVDLGFMLPGGRFLTIIRSNTVTTPIEGPSWITDEEWMIPEDMFSRLYGMGFGFGRSSPVGKDWRKKALFSGILSSPGITSMASPVKKPKAKKFWLTVNTELIVYGATEPDALVTVQGKEIKLRPDGTFTLRFALPDGKQVIPVKATSNDGTDTRAITPVVNKETK